MLILVLVLVLGCPVLVNIIVSKTLMGDRAEHWQVRSALYEPKRVISTLLISTVLYD